MKKRIFSVLLTLIMVFGLIPTHVFAEGPSVSGYFSGLPVSADPGKGTTAWKAGTKDGAEVVLSGSARKPHSTSTLTLTFTQQTHITFEYKISSEPKYDKCTIKLGNTTLVDGKSGDLPWTGLELDVKKGEKLSIEYKKDGSGDKFDDCVYVRNFSVGTPLLVTFHANNGTEDTVQQKIFGGTGVLQANAFTNAGKVFSGWSTAADSSAVQYEDGGTVTLDQNLDLYAVWEDACTVTFKDGDSLYATVAVPLASPFGNRMPSEPTRTGYRFVGWFSGDQQLTKDTVINAAATYEAKWQAIQYTIAFDASDGQGQMNSITAVYDQTCTLPKGTFTRPGYTFQGWSTYAGASSATYDDEATVKNLAKEEGETVTLYAAWKGLPVTVTLHPNYDGATDNVRTGVVGQNYNYILDNGVARFREVKDPVRAGYIFSGWYDAPKNGTEIALTYKFTEADSQAGFHMYAHWTKGITVHFDGNGYKAPLKDKAVTPDKVYASLPYMSKSNYPSKKILEGWYIKKTDGSFGERVTKDTHFSGDEVTLIAKWRDYQYIIKYQVLYGDKSTTTGTMADQPAPFNQDVTLAPCAFHRDGYEFAGWAENAYTKILKYHDGDTINRPFEEGDDWDDGSQDGETFSLYALWKEAKSPEEKAAEEKLNAAEQAISGTYNPKYGVDSNALTMIKARLSARGINDIDVTVKEAATSNYVGIEKDGTIRFKWNEAGATPASPGTVRPSLVLKYKGTYSKESTDCLFNIPLDEAKAIAALNKVANRIGPPLEVKKPADLARLSKYPLKEGVDESTVDYNKSNDLELWTTATWTSSHPTLLAITESTSTIFAPYTVAVTLPKTDTKVTLTAKLVYNGREDLSVSKEYQVLLKGTNTAQEVDYQALLETVLAEFPPTDPRNGKPIDPSSVTSDLLLPTTQNFGAVSMREYHKGFDGKYTPILLCTDDPDVVVSADPEIGNVARMVTYQPLPGQEAKTVTVTLKILSRPSGEGRDYASMPVLASKDLVLTVQPMAQADIDAATAFMDKVCTEDVYWEGIKFLNDDRDNVEFDMQPFLEIVPSGTGYTFIREESDHHMNGISVDSIPGWYDSQLYRLFRSSHPSVVTHEDLKVTQPKYDTRVTIDSVLTYTEYAKYYTKFKNNPAYAPFAAFYQKPISTTVTVLGTDGEDPNQQPFTVHLNVEGDTFDTNFQNITDASYSCKNSEGRTAADALFHVLDEKKYTYQGNGNYVTRITDPSGHALFGGDKRFGSWSGWMFTVNGKMPTKEGDSSIYLTLGKYVLKKGDTIRLYYVACPTADGQHSWDAGSITKAATCTEAGKKTYVCTVCSDTKKEAIPATGHDTELVGAKAATCTEAGYTGDQVCKVCKATVTKGEAIPATGQALNPETATSHPKQEKPSTANTGDEEYAILWLQFLAISAIGCYSLLRKRKNI